MTLLISTTACGADKPAPAITVTSVLTSLPSLAPAIQRSPSPPSTIAVASVPTLPPIIVTNPMPAATLWPTLPPPTEDVSALLTLTARPTPTPFECPPLPTPMIAGTAAAIQHFEHGLMVWLQTKNEVWALIDSPTSGKYYWRVLPNLWYEGMPGDDPSIVPPGGKFQPVRGFGYAWRAGGGPASPPLRNDLGWAIDEEAGFNAELIYYPQGFYAPDCTWEPKSGIYELADNQGVRYQFVGEGGIVVIVTPTP